MPVIVEIATAIEAPGARLVFVGETVAASASGANTARASANISTKGAKRFMTPLHYAFFPIWRGVGLTRSFRNIRDCSASYLTNRS